jgi:hypothetical protein
MPGAGEGTAQLAAAAHVAGLLGRQASEQSEAVGEQEVVTESEVVPEEAEMWDYDIIPGFRSDEDYEAGGVDDEKSSEVAEIDEAGLHTELDYETVVEATEEGEDNKSGVPEYIPTHRLEKPKPRQRATVAVKSALGRVAAGFRRIDPRERFNLHPGRQARNLGSLALRGVRGVEARHAAAGAVILGMMATLGYLYTHPPKSADDGKLKPGYYKFFEPKQPTTFKHIIEKYGKTQGWSKRESDRAARDIFSIFNNGQIGTSKASLRQGGGEYIYKLSQKVEPGQIVRVGSSVLEYVAPEAPALDTYDTPGRP